MRVQTSHSGVNSRLVGRVLRLLYTIGGCLLAALVFGALTPRAASAAPAPQPAPAAAVVTTTTVDSGYHVVLALNSSGYPVLAYMTDAPALKLAVCGDATCTSGNISSTVTALGSIGSSLDLKLAPGNLPVISFHDRDDGDALKLARCADPLCTGGVTINTVSAGAGEYNALALNSAGNPVIAFYDQTSHHLRLAVCGDPACGQPAVTANTVTTVDDTADVGHYADLALNSAGNPVISYYDADNADLKIAICGDAPCTSVISKTVDSTGSVGEYTSLALSSAGNPVISYYDAGNADLKVAVCGDAACTGVATATVDAGEDAGKNSDLALSGGILPVVGYQDSFSAGLKLAVCHTAACTSAVTTTLVQEGVFEWGPSLALAPGNTVLVGYDNYAQVEVAACTAAGCQIPLTYPVTYNANGATGGTAPADQTKIHGVPLTLQGNSGNLVKTGLVFAGWNTQADGSGVHYAAGATYSIDAPLALYARWTCAVTTSADSGAGSLRQAVAEASPGTALCFAPTLAGQTIHFGSQIVLDKNLIISGTAPITLSGATSTRLFEVKEGVNVILYNLAMQDGVMDSTRGPALGGAIYNAGGLVIANCTLNNNLASVRHSTEEAAGGAVYSSSALTVTNSTFSGNRTEAGSGDGITSGNGRGGSIYSSGALWVAGSTFSGNTARGGSTFQGGHGEGGSIYNSGILWVASSTLGGNTAAGGAGFANGAEGQLYHKGNGGSGAGGAIYSSGALTITDSTLDGNTAKGNGGIAQNGGVLSGGSGAGGSIYSSGPLMLVRSTLRGSTAKAGKGSSDNENGLAQGGAVSIRNASLRIENSALTGNVAMMGGAVHLDNEAHSALIYNSTLAGNRAVNSVDGTTAAVPGTVVAAGLGLAALVGLARFPAGPRGRKARRMFVPLLGLPVFVLLVGSSCISATGYHGGSIYIKNGGLTLNFSTLAHNEASAGAAIFIGSTSPANQVMTSNSVLSQNSPAACNVTLNRSGGHNVVSDSTCALGGAQDENGAGAQVGALQPNGTAPLLADSAAIDHITANCPQTDQLGNGRSATCDAGAVEYGGAVQARLQTSLRAGANQPYQGDKYFYTVTVENRGAAAASGLKISLPLPSGLAHAGDPTWSAGATCTWTAPTLNCTTPLARSSRFVVTAPVEVKTEVVNAQLTVTASAEAAAAAPSAATLLVTSRGPRLPEVGEGRTYRTIQEAVDAVAAGATILVYAGTYQENVKVHKNVTIRGVGDAAKVIVDGNQEDAVIVVGQRTTVTLEGLTIRNGRNHHSCGGGIYTYSDSRLAINNSVISDNTATIGGGICVDLFSRATINNSIIRNNSAQVGGGIATGAVLTITDSVISGNTAASGGGINNYGELTVINTTIVGNLPAIGVSSGGGVFNFLYTATTPFVKVINSTISGNHGFVSGGIAGYGGVEVINSIISQNMGQAARAIVGTQPFTVRNSLLQGSGSAGNGNQFNVTDAGFVRNPGALGAGELGDLHLQITSPAIGRGVTECPATDKDGKTRSAGSCSAGAYEYQATTAGGGQALAAASAQAGRGQAATFASADGAVTLDIPAAAVTQTVHLAFALGQPTGGDGRSRSVIFTPYDGTGKPLGPEFTFLEPARLTLAYDPAQVNSGLDLDLLPMRFEPLVGSWLPFTHDVLVDQAARTVAFPIRQAGAYGLFSTPPGVYARLGASSPAGTANLDGGAPVNYALVVFNNSREALQNLALTHSLPPGLALIGWVDANGATFDGSTVAWTIPTLAGGGMQMAVFTAQVSAEAVYAGRAITSTVVLTGSGGLRSSGEAAISVNGPTTAVDDDTTTRPGEAVTLWPLANDSNPDGSPLRLVGLGNPAGGTANILGDTIVYTPTPGFEGTDTFTYQLQDGQFRAQAAIRVRVARLAWLMVAKTVAPAGQSGRSFAAVPQGSVVEYTIVLGNAIDSEIAQNAVLTDALPAGVQFSGWITQSGATLENGVITWRAQSMPAGSLATISFRALVSGEPAAEVANTVTASAANGIPTQSTAILTVEAPVTRWLYLPLLQRAAAGSLAPPP